MNQDLVAGSWNQLKGRVLVRWSLLIGDHLGVIIGKRRQRAGERQSAYGALRSKTLRGSVYGRVSSSVPSSAGNQMPKASVSSMPVQAHH